MQNLIHIKEPDCFIHSDGTIWTLSHHHNNKKLIFRKLNGIVDKDGYIVVHIGKNYRLHRLIAEAFIPNPHNLPVVDHINRKRSDNRVSNLRWSSIKDNANNTVPKLARLITVRRCNDKKEYTKQLNRLTRKKKLPMINNLGRPTCSGILTEEEYNILKPLSQKDRYIVYKSWGKRNRHKLLSNSNK